MNTLPLPEKNRSFFSPLRQAPALVRYGSALALGLIAFALQHLLDPLGDTLLFPVILFTACSLGAGPALLGLATCLLLSRVALPFPESPLRLALFASLSLGLICYVFQERRAARRQRQNEERMALALVSGNIGYWDWDAGTGILTLSKSLRDEWGIPKKSTPYTLADCLPLIHDEDRDRVLQKIDRSLHQGEPYDIDYRVCPPQGEEIWIRARGMAYTDEEGTPSRLSGITLNITDRKRNELALKESERKFRELADSMPQMVWTADASGKPEYHNAKWFEYTGLTREQSTSEGWLSCLHEEDRPRAIDAWVRGAKEKEPGEMEIRFRRASDGAYRWVLIRALPLKDTQGNVTRWYGTNTDIEDQKQAQAALADALHARDEFLSIASHELKTPLTSLRLHSQLFLKKALRGESCIQDKTQLSGFASHTDKQVARISRLVDDMLDIGRIRSGKLAIQRERFDLCALLREMAERARSQSVLPLGLELAGDCQGEWDRARLEQAIENLLTNAIRYGLGKPVTLRLRPGPEKVRIEVEDQGIGISKNAQARIFDRFERAIDSNEVSGLGLGLFIARQIISAHGGTIWVESEPRSGSTFFIDLPRQACSRADSEVSLFAQVR